MSNKKYKEINNPNLFLYEKRSHELTLIPYEISKKLKTNEFGDEIKIHHSEASFEVDGLVETCKFFFKNNLYEFYFQKEYIHNGMGQFVLYYNHERVLSTITYICEYDSYGHADYEVGWLSAEDEKCLLESNEFIGNLSREVKKEINCNIQKECSPYMYKDIDGHRAGEQHVIERNDYGTVVSNKIDANLWIDGLLECHKYLEGLDKEQSSDDVTEEVKNKDVLTLAQKIAKKLLLP